VFDQEQDAGVATLLAGCDDLLLKRALERERLGVGHSAEVADVEMCRFFGHLEGR